MQVRIEMTYKTKKGTEAQFFSDEMQGKEAIMIAEDLEKTGRVKELTFIDPNGVHWSYKQLLKYYEEIQTEAHHIQVYFDGGFDSNTNRAGLGIVIYYEQNEQSYRLRKNALVDNLISNNEAEYAALHSALVELELMEVHHLPVTFIGDSKVVVNQLNDEWPCYEAELSRWINRIEKKIEELGISPTFENVSRKLNREADQLATQALQGVEISSVKEI